MVRQTSAANWIQRRIMCRVYFDVRARSSFHRHFYVYILMLDCTISEFVVKEYLLLYLALDYLKVLLLCY